MGMIGNSLAQGLISGANIQDGTVDTPDIKDSAVTTAKINDSAVTAAKIASAVVTPAKMDFSAGTANSVLYLNGSKVASSGSSLVFDGTNMGLGVTPSAGGATANYKLLEVGLGGGASLYAGQGQSLLCTNVAWSGGTANYKASSIAPLMYSQESGTHIWKYAASGTAGNAITFTQAMTLDASGNLGIGYTPNAWGGGYKALQISGAGRAFAGTGAGAGDLTLAFNAHYDSTNSRWQYVYTGDPASRYSTTGGAHIWYTAPTGTGGNAITFTQAMTLDGSGKLGVGNTSPQARLDLGSSYGADGEKFLIYNDNNTSALAGTKMGFYIDRFGESNSATFVFPYASGTSSKFHVAYKATAGTTITDVCSVTAGSSSWSFASDERMKDIIEPITGALAMLDGIRTVYYSWKLDESKKRKVGTIAQDWLVVAPEVVDVPETEFDLESSTGHMTLAGTDTIPILIAAIKELKAEFDAYKEAHP